MSLHNTRVDEARACLLGIYPAEVQFMVDRTLTELTDGMDLNVDYTWDETRRAIRALETRREMMSPPGQILGSTKLVEAYPLLEQRRWEYMIPDSAWDMHPAYDRLLAYQIPMTGKRAAEKSRIIMSAAGEDRARRTSPEGIVLVAGLEALDVLRAHGMDVGHHVGFIQNYLWSKPIRGLGDAAEERVAVLRAGDLIGSVDTARDFASGVTAFESLDGIHHIKGRVRIDLAAREEDY